MCNKTPSYGERRNLREKRFSPRNRQLRNPGAPPAIVAASGYERAGGYEWAGEYERAHNACTSRGWTRIPSRSPALDTCGWEASVRTAFGKYVAPPPTSPERYLFQTFVATPTHHQQKTHQKPVLDANMSYGVRMAVTSMAFMSMAVMSMAPVKNREEN
eukprot:1195435-Prorocentrum_minimum.AAC.7